MDRLNHLMVDSTQSVSDLCLIGAKEGTDKSPYGSGLHRHPYTSVYDLLFAAKRYEPITFGEVGIFNNASMRTWHSYFPNAEIFGFEFDEALIKKAQADNLDRVKYSQANVDSKESLAAAFLSAEKLFDVLIDDSTHLFDHQMNFVSTAVKFVKAGGAVIVEDVFRPWSEERYLKALDPYLRYFSSGTFIDADHTFKKSDGTQEPYYDNDKILVLYRNDFDPGCLHLESAGL